MGMHFEELWEKCEEFHKQNDPDGSSDSNLILDELIMKLNLYKVLSIRTEISSEEMPKVKSHALGEILLSLTKLSLTDNINVFDALNTSLYHRITSGK